MNDLYRKMALDDGELNFALFTYTDPYACPDTGEMIRDVYAYPSMCIKELPKEQCRQNREALASDHLMFIESISADIDTYADFFYRSRFNERV